MRGRQQPQGRREQRQEEREVFGRGGGYPLIECARSWWRLATTSGSKM